MDGQGSPAGAIAHPAREERYRGFDQDGAVWLLTLLPGGCLRMDRFSSEADIPDHLHFRK